MPNRLNSWKATIKGKLHSKQARPALQMQTGDVGTSGGNTLSSNSDLPQKPMQANSERIPTHTDADLEPGKPNSAHVEVTQQPLAVIPESSQELSQSEDMKYFYPKRRTRSSGSSDSKGTSQLPPRYLENLNNQDFSVLIQDLRTRLITAGGCHTQHYLDITSALEEKYNVLHQEMYSALLQPKDGPYETTEDE